MFLHIQSVSSHTQNVPYISNSGGNLQLPSAKCRPSCCSERPNLPSRCTVFSICPFVSLCSGLTKATFIFHNFSPFWCFHCNTHGHGLSCQSCHQGRERFSLPWKRMSLLSRLSTFVVHHNLTVHYCVNQIIYCHITSF